jgi:putative endonuclease
MFETSDVSSREARFYIYILYSLRDKGLYIGFTIELKNRLIRHASGKVTATKFRRPLKLIHYEYFINKEDAKSREEFLKSGYGRKQLKEFLKKTSLGLIGEKDKVSSYIIL